MQSLQILRFEFLKRYPILGRLTENINIHLVFTVEIVSKIHCTRQLPFPHSETASSFIYTSLHVKNIWAILVGAHLVVSG